MGLPLNEETSEARLNRILERKELDLQHMALLGPRVADHAWEDAVYRALRQLEIYDTHEDKSQDLELALYLTVQGEIRQVGHQFLTKMDVWVVMYEARRRMDGELPRGPPGKKKPRYPGENEGKTFIIERLRERTNKELEAQGYEANYLLTSKGKELLKNKAMKAYYSNPAIPRGLDDE